MQADGRYVKLYLNEKRISNMPNADFGRLNYLVFEFRDNNNGGEQYPPLITDISVNAGGMDLYDALAADGRVATRGILFDTGSDRLRPESTPTLSEIVTMLKAHADLAITIEGHTDDVGAAATNQALSEKRAAAVEGVPRGPGDRRVAAGVGGPGRDEARGAEHHRRGPPAESARGAGEALVPHSPRAGQRSVNVVAARVVARLVARLVARSAVALLCLTAAAAPAAAQDGFRRLTDGDVGRVIPLLRAQVEEGRWLAGEIQGLKRDVGRDGAVHEARRLRRDRRSARLAARAPAGRRAGAAGRALSPRLLGGHEPGALRRRWPSSPSASRPPSPTWPWWKAGARRRWR